MVVGPLLLISGIGVFIAWRVVDDQYQYHARLLPHNDAGPSTEWRAGVTNPITPPAWLVIEVDGSSYLEHIALVY